MDLHNITLEGIRIRYRDNGGDGPVLLMSSGVGQSLEFWDCQFDALSGRFRLIAWDYPSHGESDPGTSAFGLNSLSRLCIALLDALDVSRVVLVGNSLGGAVSLRVQALAPARVAGLVLVAPAFTGPKVFAPFKLFTLPVLGSLLTKPSEKAVAMQVSGVFHPKFVPDKALMDAIRRNVFKPGAQQPFLDFMRATLSLSGVRRAIVAETRDLFRDCSCPILLVHGMQDKIIPSDQSRDCAALAPDATFEAFDVCGHAPQLEHPNKFNDLLGGFLNRLAGFEVRKSM